MAGWNRFAVHVATVVTLLVLAGFLWWNFSDDTLNVIYLTAAAVLLVIGLKGRS